MVMSGAVYLPDRKDWRRSLCKGGICVLDSG